LNDLEGHLLSSEKTEMALFDSRCSNNVSIVVFPKVLSFYSICNCLWPWEVL